MMPPVSHPGGVHMAVCSARSDKGTGPARRTSTRRAGASSASSWRIRRAKRPMPSPDSSSASSCCTPSTWNCTWGDAHKGFGSGGCTAISACDSQWRCQVDSS
eukprot:CAMPEP_0114311830 /NCGR_PEP_ID=MMETSP0059-20121206/20059_1 /TAXON_ID=36894 /ORGANISM="Pyramimonas parkeae, Strain CCMP726" /LENGTH=102 /DNA_ID=CAMNT_0001436081 /DNA_START=378 /DNA_END=683 /DNA_ORIENTATION=-